MFGIETIKNIFKFASFDINCVTLYECKITEMILLYPRRLLDLANITDYSPFLHL